MKTKTIAIMGVMTALAVLLVTFNFPIFPAAPHLKYDPADIPIFVMTYLYGPGIGLVITVIVSAIQAFAMGGDGIIGMFMHIIATGSFVLVAGLIYKRFDSVKGILLSAICGTLVWLISMIGWNILMTPLLYGTPKEAVYAILLPVIIPFNIIKPAINVTVSILLFYALKNVAEKYLKN